MTQESKAPETQEQQMQMLRASLLNTVFNKYHELITMIRTLPLAPTNGLTQGMISIDTGMLWIKEMINIAQINLPSAPIATSTPDEPKSEETLADPA